MKAELSAKRRRVLRRYTAQDRERLIQAHARSGLTIKAFCERENIKPQTFYWWTKQTRALQRRPQFAEVEVAPRVTAAVEVLLPNGARVGIRHQGRQDELVALVRGWPDADLSPHIKGVRFDGCRRSAQKLHRSVGFNGGGGSGVKYRGELFHGWNGH